MKKKLSYHQSQDSDDSQQVKNHFTLFTWTTIINK